jgi:periplasmic copper chaperone A
VRMKHSSISIRLMLLAISCAVFLFSSTLSAQNADVVTRDAWARVPLPSKMDTAVYMVVENHTPQSRTIVSVSSDAAAAAEMHQMTMTKMMMVMTPVSQVSIPAKGKTSFDPNNFHIMLFGLKTRPAVGDKIHVTLKLDDGTMVPVEATVRK